MDHGSSVIISAWLGCGIIRLEVSVRIDMGVFCFLMGSRGTYESWIHFGYVCVWIALRGVLDCSCDLVSSADFNSGMTLLE